MWLIIFISQKSCRRFLPVCLLSALQMLKLGRTWLADKEMLPLIPFPKQNNTTPTEAMEFVQGNLLPFCLSAWGDDKKTRKSLKNWIRITVQWLLSSEALGRTGNWVSKLPRITHSILPMLWGEGNERIPTQAVSSKAMHTRELLWFLAKTSVCFPSFSPFIFKAFHVSYLSVCYGLNGAPLPKCLCWHSNPQCLRMWPYVEKRSLKEGIKLKWGN